MKVIVISPEHHDPREAEVVPQLIAAGLQWYHLRKPSWSESQMQQWIEALPAACRPHIVIHRRGCSTHNLAELSAALGKFDYVFFSPVFPSISKPGYGPGVFDRTALKKFLNNRPTDPPAFAGPTAGKPTYRPTEVFALGGITAANAPECFELGFDGVAVLGAIWQSTDPVGAYLRVAAAFPGSGSRQGLPAFGGARGDQGFRTLPPIMCLTQDGLPLSHVEQTRQLCDAGARWIQFRMKSVSRAEWLSTAREVVTICRQAGALCVVNDSVEVALDSGADGVHLGKGDGEWTAARRMLGPGRIVGGTVNDADDARHARESRCLDYVGVGPLRFTTTKSKLSPVLGLEGIRRLIAELGGLPAWVIGGVLPSDLPEIRGIHASGVAVSASLYREGRIEENFRAFASEVGRPLADCRLSDNGTAQAPALHTLS